MQQREGKSGQRNLIKCLLDKYVCYCWNMAIGESYKNKIKTWTKDGLLVNAWTMSLKNEP